MVTLQEIVPALVLLWAVIDPIGTVAVFISATQGIDPSQRRKIAASAAAIAAGILLFFIIIGGFYYGAEVGQTSASYRLHKLHAVNSFYARHPIGDWYRGRPLLRTNRSE